MSSKVQGRLEDCLLCMNVLVCALIVYVHAFSTNAKHVIGWSQ